MQKRYSWYIYCSVPKISSVNVAHFVFQQTRFAKKYWKNKIEGIPVLKLRAMVKRSIKIFQKIVKKIHQKIRQKKIVKINSSKNSSKNICKKNCQKIRQTKYVCNTKNSAMRKMTTIIRKKLDKTRKQSYIHQVL